uniref:Uncharacterized protein n=1 Tax=Agrotis segetum granulosis virus TaxID=10464 RepID=A0A023MIB3_GVAS|nr:hypothetical protein AsGV008 [Agrotis segetum granulovirus]
MFYIKINWSTIIFFVALKRASLWIMPMVIQKRFADFFNRQVGIIHEKRFIIWRECCVNV